MGNQSGRLNSTRARVDHVTNDHQLPWYLLCAYARACVCERVRACVGVGCGGGVDV